jgi:uncharacterized Zn ribbon protein
MHSSDSSKAADETGTDVKDTDLKILTDGDIKDLKNQGEDPEALKGGRRTGGVDLYKDKQGNVYILPKGGKGSDPEPTGVTLTR